MGRRTPDRPAVASGCIHIRTLEQVSGLATLLAARCREPDGVAVGLTELLVNAIEHGNLGIDHEEKAALVRGGTWLQEIERRLSLPQYAGRLVTVAYARQAETMRVSVRDEGGGFDAAPYLKAEKTAGSEPHGRGIAMAKASGFESLRYAGRGKHVEVTIPLAEAGPGA